MDTAYGPPAKQFPLQSDPMPDPLEKDSGVTRDVNGFLKLDSTHLSYNYLWVPNGTDLGGAGSVSKLDDKTVREVARYPSTTCYSLKTGSTAACDGMNGCCSVDDVARYQARKSKQPEPPHAAVQRTANGPSRTSVDFNGDLFVANMATGGQSSVTKITNDPRSCIDRNRNGKIDTSRDVNGNGFIEVDCNGDGQPDDIAGVKAKPCTNGMAQEFFGPDDECVLWTSDTFDVNAIGSALALVGGDTNIDAWAGSQRGQFVRLDGVTGIAKDDAQLPQECQNAPINGVAPDAQGIAWVPDLGAGKLCYFDARKNSTSGSVRDPSWGVVAGNGIAIDRDQNVWVGGTVARYTPDRSNGFKNLGNGWWTRIGSEMATTVAADSRNANTYFTYLCQGQSVLQVPASTIKAMKMDQMVMNPGWPSIKMPCAAVAVDSDQDVWGVSNTLSTRALVDFKGMITQPNVNAPPKGNNVCPAGDSCQSEGGDAYSDFTMFGLRSGGPPTGTYSVLVRGCSWQGATNPHDTEWWAINYEADVPPNTTLIVHAKSGDSSDLKDPSWSTAQWTMDATLSPVALQGALTPNLTPDQPNAVVHDSWLLVEFVFRTAAQNAAPVLKHFDVAFKCPGGL
jgi:hypothetical protein